MSYLLLIMYSWLITTHCSFITFSYFASTIVPRTYNMLLRAFYLFFRICCLLPVPSSLLRNIHFDTSACLLITYFLFLITEYSRFNTYYLVLITYVLLLITHHSVLVTYSLSFIAQYVWLILFTYHVLRITYYLLLFVPYLLLLFLYFPWREFRIKYYYLLLAP